LGLDYLVATAFGAARIADAHRALVDGVWLALGRSVALTIVLHLFIPFLPSTAIQPAVLADGIPYLYASTWSLAPLLLFTAVRRYLQALGSVRAVMVTVVSANVVNALACIALVFGRFGAPALGPAGAGWATTASRVYMLGCLVAYVAYRAWRHPTGLDRVSVAP